MKRLERKYKGLPDDFIAATFKEYFDDHCISCVYIASSTEFLIKEKLRLRIDSGHAFAYSCRSGVCPLCRKLNRKEFEDFFHYTINYILNTLGEI